MKENVKNTTKALYTMCICLIVVMGVLFLGNSLTKGTYSAGTVLTKNTKYCSKSGYVLNGSKCCPSGYGLYNGGVSCCPSGYSWSSNDLICVNSSGKQINATAAVAASTCKAGNILNGNTCTANPSSSSSGGTSGGNCPGGQFYFEQSLSCLDCVAGTYCKAGSTQGTPCPEGFYCPAKSSYPMECPSDKPKSKAYSKSINDCYASSTSCENKSQGECAGKYGASNCVMDSNGCWVKKSTTDTSGKKYTYKFYNKDGSVLLGVKTCTVNQSTGLCTTAITPPSCSGQWSGQKNCPTNSVKVGPNFFGNTDNLIGDSSWYCCEGSSGSDSSSSTPPIPEPPTTSSTSSNPPTSTPTSTPSSNVDENPKTGSIAIFMVWVIAIGTLIYSIAYFKQSKFE